MLNCFLLPCLSKVNTLDHILADPITRPNRSQQVINRIWHSFIYTTTIFFRLTLKVEKINWDRKLGSFYLLMIYLLGLVCLAYMANFVLQK